MATAQGFDLKGLTISELQTLIGLAQAELDTKKASFVSALRQQMEKLASNAGLTLDDVVGDGKGKRKTRAKAEPKYANPANTSERWSGRGRKPKWVENYLKSGAGKKLEDLLIATQKGQLTGTAGGNGSGVPSRNR